MAEQFEYGGLFALHRSMKTCRMSSWNSPRVRYRSLRTMNEQCTGWLGSVMGAFTTMGRRRRCLRPPSHFAGSIALLNAPSVMDEFHDAVAADEACDVAITDVFYMQEAGVGVSSS